MRPASALADVARRAAMVAGSHHEGQTERFPAPCVAVDSIEWKECDRRYRPSMQHGGGAWLPSYAPWSGPLSSLHCHVARRAVVRREDCGHHDALRYGARAQLASALYGWDRPGRRRIQTGGLRWFSRRSCRVAAADVRPSVLRMGRSARDTKQAAQAPTCACGRNGSHARTHAQR